MSPVSSHSSSKVSAVFSGRLRYPGMTEFPLTMTSPSSASRISMPGTGGPTVPSFTFSGGFIVATPHVSDIPHSSPIGIPIAWKNSSTSTGVGAAPTLTAITSARPRLARSFEKSCSSA